MTELENVEEIYPLSPMQHLMLLHAIAARNNGVLLNQVAYDVSGALDVEHFRSAWETVVARHSALRTAFVWEGLAQPLQVVRGSVTLPFRYIDLAAMGEASRLQRVGELQREDLDTPVVLAQAPLMRCTLAKTGIDKYCFIWSIHHLVVDRWSHALIFADLRDAYQALLEGRALQLPEAGRFGEYVAWASQQDRLEPERFWRAELGSLRVPRTLLPDVDARDRQRMQTRLALSISDTLALRARAAVWRTTPAAILLAAAGIAYSTLTDSDNVVVGVTVSGRPPELPEASNTVGSFVNSLPAHISLLRTRTLGEWVRELQRAQFRRQAFAHVSLADIQQWSELPPSQPLFELLVLLNLSDESDIEWPRLQLTPTYASLDSSHRLLLSFTMADGCAVMTLVHDRGFEVATQLLDALRDSVTRIVSADDGALLGDIVPATSEHGHSSAWSSVDVGRNVLVPDDVRTSNASLDAVLLQTWKDVLGTDNAGLDDDFFALGGTSLQAAQLFARIERVTGLTLPLSTLLRARSVRALLEEIGKPLPPSGPLVSIRSSGRRAPLYVMPGVAGNVFGLHAFADALGPDQPVGAFESPGLDGREEPAKTIEEIAHRYVEELLTRTARPFHLFGLCWGASVAFEMARQLNARGNPPLSLMMMNPAKLYYPVPESSRVVSKFVRGRIRDSLDAWREADWKGRRDLLTRKAKRALRVVSGRDHLHDTRFELHLARVGAVNLAALRRYNPGHHEGMTCLFLTSERDFGGGADWCLEWVPLITPTPRVVSIGGNTTGSAMAPPHLQAFLAEVRAWIDIVDARQHSG